MWIEIVSVIAYLTIGLMILFGVGRALVVWILVGWANRVLERNAKRLEEHMEEEAKLRC